MDFFKGILGKNSKHKRKGFCGSPTKKRNSYNKNKMINKRIYEIINLKKKIK
jgi:hypothetical protein